MSSSMSDSNLEKKFINVTNTQDSIQSLSLWIIHHKNHCKKIVDVWMKVLKKAKISHRLALFYLANDVIQNSRRKGAQQYLEAFSNVLGDAALLLRDDKIKPSVERVLTIWEARAVYPPETIEELKAILCKLQSNNKTPSAAVTKIVAEFKYENTIEKIRTVSKIEKESSLKLVSLNSNKFDAANSEILRQFKDRKHGQQFSKDFEDATQCLEEYIEILGKEIVDRTELIQVIEQTEIYYDTQRGEARIVANAYKNFSNRVTAQKKRIEEIISKLPSPFPSPCEDAPSPTNSEGLDFSSAPEFLASPKSDSIPSPEGTPEGLRLSPHGDPIAEFTHPIASFMPQAGMMPSWLEAFQSGSPASNSPEPKGNAASSSLDSRLMNMMHKIPTSTVNQQSAATALFLEQKNILALGGDDTPVKDEHSGQGTPVLDEESNGPRMTVNNKQTNSNNAKLNIGGGASHTNEGATKNSHRIGFIPSSGSMKPPTGTWKHSGSKSSSSDWTKNASLSGKNNSVSLVSEKTVKKDCSPVEPLQPPPKPNFGNFGMLESPPSTSFSGNNIIINPSKPRQDPRLNSQSYKSSRQSNERQGTVQGDDDTELMDMEIEDSEDEGMINNNNSNSNNNNNNGQKKDSEENKSGKKTNIEIGLKDTDERVKISKEEQRIVPVVVTDHKNVEIQNNKNQRAVSSSFDGNVSQQDLKGGTRMSGRGGMREAHHQRTQSQPPKETGRGFSQIETIQSLRGDDWDSQRPEDFMPNYDAPPPSHHLRPPGNYARQDIDYDFDPRYNGHPYPDYNFDNGGPPQRYGGPPQHKGFAPRAPRPFQRGGRRGFYPNRY